VFVFDSSPNSYGSVEGNYNDSAWKSVQGVIYKVPTKYSHSNILVTRMNVILNIVITIIRWYLENVFVIKKHPPKIFIWRYFGRGTSTPWRVSVNFNRCTALLWPLPFSDKFTFYIYHKIDVCVRFSMNFKTLHCPRCMWGWRSDLLVSVPNGKYQLRGQHNVSLSWMFYVLTRRINVKMWRL
jgi:hypothetical protein